MRDVAKLGVTTGEMARFTGMSRRFFTREIEHGEIAAAKFGEVYRIPADEATKYLSSRGWPVPDVLKGR